MFLISPWPRPSTATTVYFKNHFCSFSYLCFALTRICFTNTSFFWILFHQLLVQDNQYQCDNSLLLLIRRHQPRLVNIFGWNIRKFRHPLANKIAFWVMVSRLLRNRISLRNLCLSRQIAFELATSVYQAHNREIS